MKVIIEFDIDGAAFGDDPNEVDKILKRAAEKIYNNRTWDEDCVGDLYDEFTSNLRDTYGNTVGTVTVKD